MLLQVSKDWADLSDTYLKEICQGKRWAMPRRPRGDAAKPKHFPWRSLYRLEKLLSLLVDYFS